MTAVTLVHFTGAGNCRDGADAALSTTAAAEATNVSQRTYAPSSMVYAIGPS
jgi:hypothetical protein